MDTTPSSEPTQAAHRRADVGVILLLAVVWVMAALLRPGATFHLGPLLLPLVPLVTVPEGLSPTRPILVGVGVGAIVIVLLAGTAHLDGPAYDPFPSAMAESVAFLFGAGAGGLVLTRWTR